MAVRGLPEGMLEGRRMLLVTAHRRESFGEAFREMCLALRRIVDDAPEVCVVYPVHLNPNVDGPARSLLAGHERIALLEPAGYAEFVTLLERAHIVLTDSGGVQEEAPTFAKPLLVMREVTERPEGIAAGVARLVGTSGARIHAETMRLLRDEPPTGAWPAATTPTATAWRRGGLPACWPTRWTRRTPSPCGLNPDISAPAGSRWRLLLAAALATAAGCATAPVVPRAVRRGLQGSFLQLTEAPAGLRRADWSGPWRCCGRPAPTR